MQLLVAFRDTPDHFECVFARITSIFINRHRTLHYLFFLVLPIHDITFTRQSGPDAELWENVDINEKPRTNNGKDEDKSEH